MAEFFTLKKNSDFNLIKNKSKDFKTRSIVAKISDSTLLNQDIYSNQNLILGITISRKIGKAVTRNLIKRRIKHIIKLSNFSAQTKNLVLSLYIRKAATYISFVQLKKDLDKILKSV